jgi:hypothetical protein
LRVPPASAERDEKCGGTLKALSYRLDVTKFGLLVLVVSD